MNIERALSLISDLATVYGGKMGIPLEKTPPQYIIYAHSIIEKDTVRMPVHSIDSGDVWMLAHNVNSEDMDLWGDEIYEDMHAEPDAEGFIFFAIVQLDGFEGDSLLVSLFDIDLDVLQTYVVDLDMSEWEEIATPFFFKGLEFSNSPTIH